jgi:hypothetical protein
VKKPGSAALLVTARIARQILVVRDHKVMVDAGLAALYGVPTKRLNEQVKRNVGRFPADFVFQLSRAERDEVVANCDHLQPKTQQSGSQKTASTLLATRRT